MIQRYLIQPQTFIFMVVFLAVFLLLVPAAAEAEELRVFTITHENDLFALQDSYYTSGIRLNWFSGADNIPHVFKILGDIVHIDDPAAAQRMSYSVGQNMFTPLDITDPDPPEEDRPYAGWLYLAGGLIQDRGDGIDAYELKLGVVGPSSKARETQEFAHKYIWGEEPVGWEDQLRDELGIQFLYGQQRNLWTRDVIGSTKMEFVPGWMLSLGNIQTSLRLSGGLRWGNFSGSDYGPPMVRNALPGSGFYVQEDSFEWYGFMRVGVQFVAYEVFLDGNLLHDGPEAERIPWVSDLKLGMVASWEHVRLSYTHVFPGREFEGQKNTHHYGALAVSIRF